MANLSLKHVYKIYPSRETRPSLFKRLKTKGKVEEPKDFVAVKDFNLEINDGEFIVFVGPSGCGKSTTLRMIAGLEEISAGELYLDGKLLNNVDPMNRDMAMVFQSYALYPHLSAYDNIAFGLRMRKIDAYKVKIDAKNPDYINEKKALDDAYASELKEKVDSLKAKEASEDEISNASYEIKNKYDIKNDELNEKFSTKLYSFDANKVKELEKELSVAKKNKDSSKVEEIKKQIAEVKSVLDTPVMIKRHYTKAEIDRKVQWAAQILGIKKLLKRRPTEMSGGQCQRVALGRAIVRGPKLFLLDEPLSNLDAKLRTSMRSEIVKLHQRLKTTFIYVTHDQIEAMTMGTRIVVMKDGITQQIDTPINLFNHPKNIFVAGFIGTPQMNFFNVDAKKVKNNFEVTFADGNTIALDIKKMRTINDTFLDGESHKLTLGVRAEHINVVEKGLPLYVSVFEVLGSSTQVFAHLGNDEKDIIISVFGNQPWATNQEINVSFNEENVHLFDEDGQSILGDE